MNATIKRPVAAGHVTDDPRYQAAARKYSEILADRDSLKARYEEAHALENARPLSATAAAARYLAGEAATESQPSAKLWADLTVREEAMTLQRQEMDRIAQQVSGELCAAEKGKHDALAKRLATALREAKEADQALSTFTAELMRRGVQPTYPVLAFLPARESGAFYSIDGWQARYADHLG